MAKADVISAAITAYQAAEIAALTEQMGKVWDESALEQHTADGTLTSADMDLAVKKAVDAAKAGDAKAMTDAVAAVQSQLDALTKTHADLVAKESAEAHVIDGLKGSIVSLQSVLTTLNGLVAPAPVPAPAVPAPATPAAPVGPAASTPATPAT